MPVDRFFVDADFIESKTVSLTGEEFHHLCKVTRHGVGEKIELVNGRGQLAYAKIETIEKKQATLFIHDIENKILQGPKIILGQIIPKWNRLDTIIEKGTELGVHGFWLIPSLHAKKETFSTNQLERLHNITVAAMKQCGRLDLPAITFQDNLKKTPKIEAQCYFGDTREGAVPLWKSFQGNRSIPETILFFTGPEGGFLPEEIQILENTWKAQPVSLSGHILRTDTASITALALLQHWTYT